MRKSRHKQKLLPEQEYDLNKMFYRDYMVEYFDEKVILLVDLLGDSNGYIKKIVSNELTIGNLKFKADSTYDSGKIEKYAKYELVATYYHCLETFMRLFIAHTSFKSCPFIELRTIKMDTYHNILNQIANGNFDNLNKKFNSDDTILLTLIGIKKDKNLVSERQLINLRSWIIFCASELQKMNEYNSFKHGLSMFSGFGMMKVTNPIDGKTILEKEGDAIHIIECKKDKDQSKLNLTSIFVEYDLKVILILFYNELIKNIIQVGNYRYTCKDANAKISAVHFTEFDYHELRKIFNKKSNIGDLLSSYSMQLLYEDDLEKKEDN